ncbi:MAG: cold shock domain-containing protein [Alphaproteobacteria bacterium]|nr:cold shock domain-containing protein [Alphaproteobacteria bacterium]
MEVKGQVKWYSGEKGFGFVVTEDGGKDVFVHASALQRSNLSSLEPDSRVIMKVVDGSKGREALTVVLA